MEEKIDRAEHIIQVTIALLGEEGADNLSMRKVAKAANISLSNLQYYYRNREALLISTVERYFKECEEEVIQMLHVSEIESISTPKLFFENLLELIFFDGKTNPKTIMFREIAALSSRNKELETAVSKYYKEYCNWLEQIIGKYSEQPEHVVSLLVPYIEGYSNIGTVLPLDKKAIIQMFLTYILSLQNN